MANITQGENNTVYHWKEHLTTNVFFTETKQYIILRPTCSIFFIFSLFFIHLIIYFYLFISLFFLK